MASTYEEMTSVIPNTTMRKLFIDGVFRTYNITPNEGYVLHDTQYDTVRYEYETDEETGETIEIAIPVLGYHTMTVTCGYFYEFTPIEMQDEAGNTVTAYGDRKFYCKPASDVEQPEVM